MSFSIIDVDAADAKRNRVLSDDSHCIAYNAVLSTVFSNEGTVEPVILDDVKKWLRVDIDDDDDLISALITAARIFCENYANLSFITRTVTAKIHNGLGNFVLPYGPVIGDITSVTDNQGVVLTANYKLTDAYANDVTVVYDVGYDVLPENFKTAIYNQIGFLFENRGDLQKATGLSPVSKLLLSQVRNV